MLSKKEQEEWKRKKHELNEQLYKHQWHYALEELGLKDEINAVYSKLKDAELVAGEYELNEKLRQVRIPIKDGEIILVVAIDHSGYSTIARILRDEFKPDKYRVIYDIKGKDENLKEKASSILDEYFISRRENRKRIMDRIRYEKSRRHW